MQFSVLHRHCDGYRTRRQPCLSHRHDAGEPQSVDEGEDASEQPYSSFVAVEEADGVAISSKKDSIVASSGGSRGHNRNSHKRHDHNHSHNSLKTSIGGSIRWAVGRTKSQPPTRDPEQ